MALSRSRDRRSAGTPDEPAAETIRRLEPGAPMAVLGRFLLDAIEEVGSELTHHGREAFVEREKDDGRWTPRPVRAFIEAIRGEFENEPKGDSKPDA